MENDLIRRKELADSIQQLDIYPVCIRRAIERAPSVDAVEVVRCKDCAHKSTWYEELEYGHAIYICGLSGMIIVEDNDFCSYGERKENEQQNI